MQSILIIGTVHAHHTPAQELESLLTELNPAKIHLELTEKELHERNATIRIEMLAAYDWALAHHVPINIFDDEESEFKPNVTGTEAEFREWDKEVVTFLHTHSWKDLNRQEFFDIPRIKNLDDKISRDYLNRTKRQQVMLKNIRSALSEGLNVILTGAGHLSFFEKNLPEATLPFRVKQ